MIALSDEDFWRPPVTHHQMTTRSTAPLIASRRCESAWVFVSSAIRASLDNAVGSHLAPLRQEKYYAKADNFVLRANRLYSQAFESLFRLGAAASMTYFRTRALSMDSW